MIVVIGQPMLTRVDGNPVATGSAARIALTAADRGAAVQLIGKVGDDADGIPGPWSDARSFRL